MEKIKLEDIRLAKSGDEEAIFLIFKVFKKSILGSNSHLFLNGADTDDLLQEGYIGLTKAIKYFDESKNVSFGTFAYLCIRRQIITAVKTYNSNKNICLNNSTQNEYIVDNYLKDKMPNPEEVLLQKEFKKKIIIFSEKNLSDFEKIVFHYMHLGYKYNEIADLTEISKKKIDNTIQRIRKKFILNFNK
ncbi:MAG: sigma-70 family RNA polymerase sigma factor [Cetobacterium sp.]